MRRALPQSVTIREVGPRDGLQNESPLPVADRAALIEALVDAGVTEIEAVSFVSPKAVPSMDGAAAVLADVRRSPEVVYVALVPNVKGAELAVAAAVDALSFTVSVSETYNEKNVGMSSDGSIEQLAGIRVAAGDRPIDAVLSCAFGSPYEGDIAPAAVGRLAELALDAGATSITLADTTGMATPRRIDDVLRVTGPDVGLHLHETRGTGLVNAWAAIEGGVERFDTSVGGLGGSPFAAGAAGNLATEDLVHLLDDCGVATGIDLVKLLAVAKDVARLVGHDTPSNISRAGPRSRRAD